MTPQDGIPQASSDSFELTPAEELREDLHVDKNRLESALLVQPMLYDKYAKRAAEVRCKRDSLKVAIRVRSGEIDRDYRVNGLPSGAKPTVDAINAAIDCNPELATMGYQLAELERDLGLAESVVEAFRHRKSSLDNLCYLATSSYYQTSNASPPDSPYNAVSTARRALNNKE